MIITIDYQWHYNAPADIKVGDRVKLPGSSGDTSRWVGEVTAINSDPGAFSGPIKQILGKADPEVTFKATSHAALVRKVRAWLNQEQARQLRKQQQTSVFWPEEWRS